MSKLCVKVLRRRSVLRRTCELPNRQALGYGYDDKTYEKMRESVLQERAVKNAINALQERWKMLMLMYEDCVKMIQRRKDRNLKKLCVERQFQFIMIVSTFSILCLLLSLLVNVLD